jgi:hydrogenase expression/formation protein HypE
MRIGKLTNQELQDIVLSRLPALSSRTITGAHVGADCAWLPIGDHMLVASSDPVTAGGMQSGCLAIHVSCNDIAACGVSPIGILLVVIAPPDTTPSQIMQIIDQASETASKLGVDIVGGHTEISDAVRRFVVTTTAFGSLDKSVLVPAGKAMAGDTLLMTKTAAIEGTWIAVMEHEAKLRGFVSDAEIREGRSFLDQLSVVQEGVLAASCHPSISKSNSRGYPESAVHLMHDATEGGILGAAYEMAEFSGTGIQIDMSSIPIHPITLRVCDALELDPLRLISSGSLLIATPEPEKIIDCLSKNQIVCTAIGTFMENGFYSREGQQERKILLPPSPDELYKL